MTSHRLVGVLCVPAVGSNDVEHLMEGLGHKGLTGACGLWGAPCFPGIPGRGVASEDSRTLSSGGSRRSPRHHLAHPHPVPALLFVLRAWHAGLFESLAVLSWAVTLATLAGLAIPFVEENVLARVSPFLSSACTVTGAWSSARC